MRSNDQFGSRRETTLRGSIASPRASAARSVRRRPRAAAFIRAPAAITDRRLVQRRGVSMSCVSATRNRAAGARPVAAWKRRSSASTVGRSGSASAYSARNRPCLSRREPARSSQRDRCQKALATTSSTPSPKSSIPSSLSTGGACSPRLKYDHAASDAGRAEEGYSTAAGDGEHADLSVSIVQSAFGFTIRSEGRRRPGECPASGRAARTRAPRRAVAWETASGASRGARGGSRGCGAPRRPSAGPRLARS